MSRLRSIWILYLGVLVCSAHDLPAQTSVPTLTGVRKVATLVSLPIQQGERIPTGLTEDRLRTVLELRLRSAGLTVLTAEQDRQDPENNPYVLLEVIILAAESRNGTPLGYTFSTQISVRRYQRVDLNGSLAPAVLWENEYLNIASRDDASHEVERIVNQLADELINQWLAANPGR